MLENSLKDVDSFLKESARSFALYNGSCFDLIAALPDESVDLILTSPPYCMGKEYERNNDVGFFIEEHEKLLPEAIRVLKPGGSICWQVGYHAKNGILTPLDFHVHQIMAQHKSMSLRNRIMWTFGHGLHCSNRFSGRHEVVLWYTKGDDYFFDLDAVRVQQKYPGKLHAKGPLKGELSGNPKGKNPSDVWDIPNVKSNHVEKTDHPCQFPVALALQLVKALVPPSGVVFDPFMGSGTTGVAAMLEGKRFIGSEICTEYVDIAQKRVTDAANGEARFRPFDKEIYKPKPGEKVARRPEHFL